MTHANKQIKTIHEDLNLNINEVSATDNFIEKYLPFKMLNYIHDAMKISLNR